MCAMYPGSDQLPGIAATDIDAFLKRTATEAAPLIRLGLALATLVYTITPLITVGWPVPAFMLPAKTEARHATKLVGHPVYLIRQSVFVLKMMAGLCWGADPSVRAALSLEPYPADPGTWRTS